MPGENVPTKPAHHLFEIKASLVLAVCEHAFDITENSVVKETNDLHGFLILGNVLPLGVWIEVDGVDGSSGAG